MELTKEEKDLIQRYRIFKADNPDQEIHTSFLVVENPEEGQLLDELVDMYEEVIEEDFDGRIHCWVVKVAEDLSLRRDQWKGIYPIIAGAFEPQSLNLLGDPSLN